MIKTYRHILVAFLFFAFAALVGLIMRLSIVSEIDWNYKFLLHTHSHIALLGWVYIAISTLFYHLFLKESGIDKKYKQLFYFTLFSIVGMLFSFPFQGYALFSIIFSTLFLFASYRFTFLFLKFAPKETRQKQSFILAKWALYFLVFSSLGPWALGAIMNTLGSSSVWYHDAIYFYLHFLYNGFFIMALLAMFFFLLEKHDLALADKKFRSLLIWLVVSIFLSFFLSVLWSKPPYIFYSLATIGAMVQLVAFIELGSVLQKVWPQLKVKLLALTQKLFVSVAFILMLKIAMQTANAFPAVADFVSHSKSLIVGYLHMVFLGIVSLSIFAFLQQFRLVKLSGPALWLFGFGFVCSEFILFYHGLYFDFKLPPLPYYPLLLTVASSIIFFGLVFLLVKLRPINSNN